MAIKHALGRGLSALIPNANASRVDVDAALSGKGSSGACLVVEVPLDKVRPNPSQPRKEFDEAKMQKLLGSLRNSGILQPILVRQAQNLDGDYEIIAGERRYRAAKALGWTKIPAIVKDALPRESLELALIENIQREDLNPLEEAKAYEQLINEFNLTQETIARAVGKERSSIANTIRLLSLPEKIQEKILRNQLSAGHAKLLLSVSDKARQESLCERILKEGLSVRQVEQILKLEQPPRAWTPAKPKEQDPHIRALEEELQRVLGTRVKITSSGKGGKLQIDYYSSEDLQRVLGLMGLKKR